MVLLSMEVLFSLAFVHGCFIHLGFCPWFYYRWGFYSLELLSMGVLFTCVFVHGGLACGGLVH